jgi:hypothetical protein
MTDFVDLLEEQLVAAHARRPRGLRAALPSARGAGAIALAAAAAAAVVVLVVALASPDGHRAARPADPPAPAPAVTAPPATPAPRPATPTAPNVPGPHVPQRTPATPATPNVPGPHAPAPAPATPKAPAAPPPAPGPAIPAQPATPRAPAPAPPPSATTVAVLNASAVTGAARAVANRLDAAGYRVGVVTNRLGGLARSSVRYPAGQRAAAVALARRLRIRRVLPLSRALRREAGREADVVVVLSRDRIP